MVRSFVNKTTKIWKSVKKLGEVANVGYSETALSDQF